MKMKIIGEKEEKFHFLLVLAGSATFEVRMIPERVIGR